MTCPPLTLLVAPSGAQPRLRHPHSVAGMNAAGHLSVEKIGRKTDLNYVAI